MQLYWFFDDLLNRQNYCFNIKENEKEVFIQLTAKNPQAHKRKIQFDFETGTFISIKAIDFMIDHMDIESICLHRNSSQARQQEQQGNLLALMKSTFC